MYQSIILPYFYRQLKQLTKKYPHLKDAVIASLETFHPNQHVSLGHSLYKMRVCSKDIVRGKSKSFRMIVLLIEVDFYLVPITVYFKGDQQDISKKEINNHLEIALFELRAQSLLR